MQVHFHGAAGMVTGSTHLVEAAGRRVMLDCGMIQSSAEAEALNTADFPVAPSTLDALIVSHAHIDHVGRVPLLGAGRRNLRASRLSRCTCDARVEV